MSEAHASLSVERKTNDALKTFGIPQRTFAILVGISVGNLNEYLSGKKQLSNDTSARFAHTVALIKQLTSLAGGLPLDWSPENGRHFKLVLDALDRGQFRVKIEDLTENGKILASAAALSGLQVSLAGAPPEEQKSPEVADAI